MPGRCLCLRVSVVLLPDGENSDQLSARTLSMIAREHAAAYDSQESENKALGAEIRTLREFAKLSHRHVIQTYGIAYGAAADAPDLPFYMLLLQLCACDLGNAIHMSGPCKLECGGQMLSLAERQQLATQLACGLAFIHSKGYAHLDLKPGNVMLVRDAHSQFIVKLADFGLQYDPTAEEDGDTPYGTWGYMAPEAWKRDPYGEPGSPADVFSFGVILWEMFSRRFVYRLLRIHCSYARVC